MSGAADWDWAAQEADTRAVVAKFEKKYALPPEMEIILDIQTIASTARDARPDKAALVAALKEAGYGVRVYLAEDGIETVEATREGLAFAAEVIWRHERTVSEIALAHGYTPDGWGFMEPDT